jgi:hypothetical protein
MTTEWLDGRSHRAGGAALRQLIRSGAFAALYETTGYYDDEALDRSIARTLPGEK